MVGFDVDSDAIFQRTLEAVRTDPQALRNAVEGLRDNRQVVLEAVKRRSDALEFASERLRGDPDFLREVARMRGGGPVSARP